jgi:hypothetical protein
MSAHLLDKALPSRAAEVLRFAAAPTFALLAMAGGFPGDPPTALLCAGMPGSSPNSMSLMYGLMAAVHAVPWLKLMARSR